MKIHRLISLFIILGSNTFLNAQNHKSEFITNNRTINVDSLNKEIRIMMEEVGIPALSFAVIDKGEIVFYNNYGFKLMKKQSDGKTILKGRVNKKTIFEACSMSKIFILIPTLKLVDQGLLDLDEPLYKYFKNGYEPLKHDERYKLITARMALGNCTGLENEPSNNDPSKLEIIANPGEGYTYSGEGYTYLAKAIAQIVDMPIDKYMQEMVFKPLHLKRTYTRFYLGCRWPRNLVIGHNDFNEPFDKRKYQEPNISAFIHTTAEDYAKMMIYLFDEMEQEWKKEIITPVVPLGKPWEGDHNALGFIVTISDGDTLALKGGSNEGFESNVCYSVTNNRGFVYFTNSDRGMVIVNKLSEMTSGIPVYKHYNANFYSQYPSNASKLLMVFRKYGADKMRIEFDNLVKDETKPLREREIIEIKDCIKNKDKELTKYILKETIPLFPESPNLPWNYARISMKEGNYEMALEYFKIAKEREFFNIPWINRDIERCKNKLKNPN